jgi:hypothetical protein
MSSRSSRGDALFIFSLCQIDRRDKSDQELSRFGRGCYALSTAGHTMHVIGLEASDRRRCAFSV